jgi:hypothetical protein
MSDFDAQVLHILNAPLITGQSIKRVVAIARKELSPLSRAPPRVFLPFINERGSTGKLLKHTIEFERPSQSLPKLRIEVRKYNKIPLKGHAAPECRLSQSFTRVRRPMEIGPAMVSKASVKH